VSACVRVYVYGANASIAIPHLPRYVLQGVLAADGYGPEFMNGNSEGAAPAWSFNNDGGKVTFGGEALFGAKGAMPDQVAGPPGNRFAAATMRYT
jgi:hypothetical protein